MLKHARIALVAAIALSFTTTAVIAADSAPTPEPTFEYGPLSFNSPDGDFYVAQDGRFAPIREAEDGVLEVRLKNRPFELGHNREELAIALAEIPVAEVTYDPMLRPQSRLAPPRTGAREPESTELLVYSGTQWSDGNTNFSDESPRPAAPMPGFSKAYSVTALFFVSDRTERLATFKGTLHGFLALHDGGETLAKDTMPVRLIFE